MRTKSPRLSRHGLVNDRVFMWAVIYQPSATAACTFVFQWLVLGKDIAASLTMAAFVFILLLFIGVVYLVMKRRNQR
jgi:TRAP-type C4-dicarboxylate transport system permease small subunit